MLLSIIAGPKSDQFLHMYRIQLWSVMLAGCSLANSNVTGLSPQLDRKQQSENTNVPKLQPSYPHFPLQHTCALWPGPVQYTHSSLFGEVSASLSILGVHRKPLVTVFPNTESQGTNVFAVLFEYTGCSKHYQLALILSPYLYTEYIVCPFWKLFPWQHVYLEIRISLFALHRIWCDWLTDKTLNPDPRQQRPNGNIWD